MGAGGKCAAGVYREVDGGIAHRGCEVLVAVDKEVKRCLNAVAFNSQRPAGFSEQRLVEGVVEGDADFNHLHREVEHAPLAVGVGHGEGYGVVFGCEVRPEVYLVVVAGAECQAQGVYLGAVDAYRCRAGLGIEVGGVATVVGGVGEAQSVRAPFHARRIGQLRYASREGIFVAAGFAHAEVHRAEQELCVLGRVLFPPLACVGVSEEAHGYFAVGTGRKHHFAYLLLTQQLDLLLHPFDGLLEEGLDLMAGVLRVPRLVYRGYGVLYLFVCHCSLSLLPFHVAAPYLVAAPEFSIPAGADSLVNLHEAAAGLHP